MEELASLHQKIIHFPIAFLVIYPFVEIFSFMKKSDFSDKLSLVILIIGIFGLILALITGNSNLNIYKNISNAELKILNSHIEFANYTAWFSGILFLLRIYFIRKIKTNFSYRIIIILISIVVLYFVIMTGEFGGKTNEIITKYKMNIHK